MVRRAVAVVVVTAVAILLLVPFHPEAAVLALLVSATPHTPLARGIDWFLIETGGNLAVFALVGVALLALTRRPVVSAVLGCVLSGAAEMAQLAIPNRVPSWTDLVTNCVGTVAGVAIAWTLARPRLRRRSAQ